VHLITWILSIIRVKFSSIVFKHKLVYIYKKNPLDANMTIGELKDIANGGPAAVAAENRLRHYDANTLISSQHMAVHKRKFIALMCSKKVVTIWFTLSLANHHWDGMIYRTYLVISYKEMLMKLLMITLRT
jgi:hypothetical protein